jgi:DNA-binding response OmpR family regulator
LLRRSKTDEGEPIPIAGAPVLVVSDDAGVRQTLVSIFGGRGFTAAAVGEPTAALEHLAGSDPGAVVVDLRAGGTAQALELLDDIRAHNDSVVNRSRVVLTTEMEENRKFSWQSGADGYLVRPFHIDELVEAVTEALGRGDEEREAHREEQAQLSGDTARRAAGGPV